MERSDGIGAHLEREAEGLTDRARHLDDVGDVRRSTRTPPSRAVAVPRHEQGDVARLWRHGIPDGSQLLRRRADADLLGRRRALWPLQCHDETDLEDGHVTRAAGDVAAQCIHHRREHPGAHQRLLVGERVREPHRARDLGRDIEAQRGEPVSADERRAPHLAQSLPCQHVGNDSTHPLGVGESGTAGWCRDDRGDAVISVDASDLLDEVLGAGEVGAPGRRRDGEGSVRVRDCAADRLQDLHHRRCRVVDAHDPRREPDRHGDGGRGGRRAHVGDIDVDDPAPVLHEEVDGELGRSSREHRVDPALEAPRRLGREPVAARGPSNGDGVEVRCLDQDVGGRRAHLGLGTAHDTGDRDGPLTAPVGDQQVLGLQRPVDVVEGREPLTRTSTPDDDRCGQRCQVERVQRLAETEHDVVRHVDGQRDRAHPGLGEAHRHPARGRCRDVDAAHHAR